MSWIENKRAANAVKVVVGHPGEALYDFGDKREDHAFGWGFDTDVSGARPDGGLGFGLLFGWNPRWSGPGFGRIGFVSSTLVTDIGSSLAFQELNQARGLSWNPDSSSGGYWLDELTIVVDDPELLKVKIYSVTFVGRE
jgi:hypothetical protein